MDLSIANTEPFYRFLKFYEAFNRSMRVLVGGVESLRTEGRADPASIATLTHLPTGGEPWGDTTRWRDVSKFLSEATEFIAQMGLVRVTSAFEDFLLSVDAEIQRFWHLRNPDYETVPRDGVQLETLYKQLGLATARLKRLLPLYDYFVLVRNCVAHRSGRASQYLIEASSEPSLEASWKQLQGASERTIPKLPEVKFNRQIKFLPRHAILASELCYVIAKDVNSGLVQTLGEPGMIYMAAHHSLLADDRMETSRFRSPENAINYCVFGRYRIRGNAVEPIQILKGIEKWAECRRRYTELYPPHNHRRR